MSALRKLICRRQYALTIKSVRTLSTDRQQDVNVVRSPYDDIQIPDVTIPEFVYSKTRDYSKHTATVCAETGRSYTFEQLRTKGRSLSKALRKILKLDKGDTIAIVLPNSPEFPLCLLGCLEAGLIVTTLNPIYTPVEISKQLLDSSAKAIITFGILHDVVKAGTSLAQKQLPIVVIKTRDGESLPNGAVSLNELLESRVDIPDFQPGNADDIAILPYSSGTTGLPKGVELTHRNIVSNVSQCTIPELDLSRRPTDSFQDITPAVLPMFHIYGLTVTMVAALRSGIRTVTLSKFNPDLYISVLQKYKISLIYAAPPLVLFLTLHPGVKKEYLENVRAVMCGAAPLGALDEQRFLENAPKHAVITQGYGLTETSPVVAMSSTKLFQQGNATGSIGQIIPNTLAKIVSIDDPTGRPLGPNKSGELLVKGPQVMKRYHNRPEETENAFLDGWFRTGDLGHYNEDRLFYLTDRLKELIKVKGYQVPPAELEEIIRDFPAVDDAAVIGIPHDNHGELPRAYVVPKKDKPLNPEELSEFVAKRVAPYKQLKGGIEIVDEIPKNAAGKILRRELKLKFEGKL